MKNTFVSLIYVYLLLVSGILYAQNPTKTYQEKAGNFALAFTGIVEKGYRTGYVNTPYYPTEYTSGSLTYRGVTYTDVKLRYDCFTKRLVILSPDGKFNRVLSPEEISRAIIGNTSFVYFDSQKAKPGEGYYAVVYEGKDFSIYKQIYVSNINKESNGKVMLQKLFLKERLFLLKEGEWNQLSGKSSFIKHFKNHKKELNDYCKTHQLNPGKKNETDWQKLAEYCETLIK